ncbi:RICIN domain-containing protein [Streptomyces sp. NPDC057438]|uniref:RICIN domain-containing protein n=1 Tax=Streptomyces sp. NPDC057438 TaxID=3346133 RepID=UPI00369E8BD0
MGGGKRLEVAGLSRVDGGNVADWGRDQRRRQHWAGPSTGDGYFFLINPPSGLRFAVDEGSTAGADIEPQPYASLTLQQWCRPPVGSMAAQVRGSGPAHHPHGGASFPETGSPREEVGTLDVSHRLGPLRVARTAFHLLPAMRPGWPFRMPSRVCRAAGPPPTSDGGSPSRSAITEGNSGAESGSRDVPASWPSSPSVRAESCGLSYTPTTRTSGAVLPPWDSRQGAGGSVTVVVGS